MRERLQPIALVAVALIGCGEAEPGPGPVPEPPPGPPEPIVVMTFNVMCSFCGASEYDPWDTRLGYFEDIFARHDPDLVGLQELAFPAEVEQMLALRPGFAAVFYQPEDAVPYPDPTVLYRTDRFELLSHGFYWLSPTPDVPSSTGFAEHQLPRVVAWTELRDRRSRRQLLFATTHFDNNSPSQELSAPLLLERTAPWAARMPVVVVGDFNSQPEDEAFRVLTEQGNAGLTLADTQPLASKWSVDTNQSPAPAYDLAGRIDHIFVAPAAEQWTVGAWSADLHVFGDEQRYPSDHWPITATLTTPDSP
ncbi:MAG: endonuclease/exonuclease/phosphatase family protein [Deltaproteobacteria bacterium]|nr:endonuclease/exonuclease/phosphatase family protein [Deltaproteobacteria bacterium]